MFLFFLAFFSPSMLLRVDTEPLSPMLLRVDTEPLLLAEQSNVYPDLLQHLQKQR